MENKYYETFEEFKEELSRKENKDAFMGLLYLYNINKCIQKIKETGQNDVQSNLELALYEKELKDFEICLPLLEEKEVIDLCEKEITNNKEFSF